MKWPTPHPSTRNNEKLNQLMKIVEGCLVLDSEKRIDSESALQLILKLSKEHEQDEKVKQLIERPVEPIEVKSKAFNHDFVDVKTVGNFIKKGWIKN